MPAATGGAPPRAVGAAAAAVGPTEAGVVAAVAAAAEAAVAAVAAERGDCMERATKSRSAALNGPHAGWVAPNSAGAAGG